MKRDIDFGKDQANPSGAPEAGGATTRGSIFGGRSLAASGWRFLARVARDIEATAYRQLRDLEAKRVAETGIPAGPQPGAPRRVKEAIASRPPHGPAPVRP
jgi:hypothetical protein